MQTEQITRNDYVGRFKPGSNHEKTIQGLWEYASRIGSFMLDGGRKPEGFEYSGMYDFLIRNGVFMINGARPARVKKGPAKQCYMNAARLACNFTNKGRYVYCEGLAVSLRLGIPIEHAWIWDLQNEMAIELTWPDPSGQIVYFGVGIKRQFLAQNLAATSMYGILGSYKNGFPIFRKETPKEAWALKFY